MHLSCQNICIPLEAVNNIIMLNGVSGASVIIKKEYYDRLKNGQNGMNNPSSQCEFDKFLIPQGFITNRNEDEEIKVKEKIIDIILKKESVIKPVLLLGYDCNFSCPYCFEREYTEKNIGKTMQKATVDKCFRYLYECLIAYLEIDDIVLFGGEPFLGRHKEIISYICTKARETGLKLQAVTNGYNLDLYKDVLNKSLIRHLQITVDGVNKIHDARRYLKGGQGTFQKIMQNIEWCLENEVFVTVRTTVDNDNLGKINEFISFIYERKWNTSPFFNNYYTQIHDYINTGKTVIDFMDIVGNLKGYFPDKTVYDLSPIHHHVYKQFKDCLEGTGGLKRKAYYCGASNGILVFDPEEDIYPCYEVAGSKKMW